MQATAVATPRERCRAEKLPGKCAMEVIIENPKTLEGETIEIPMVLDFAELRKYLRKHPVYRNWKFIESRETT